MLRRLRAVRTGVTSVADRLATPWIAGLVAGLGALAVLAFLPKGEDAAAHLYQTQVWRDHGWSFWDNNWYAGRYSQINYSLLYYPLAALLHTWTVVSLSVAGSAAVFAQLLRERWPALARWPSATFTLLAPLPVLTGTYPFLLGLALALATLTALQHRRWLLAAVLGVLVALGHLLALLLLNSALIGVALTSRSWRTPGPVRRVAITFAIVFALAFVSWRAFSTPGGQYPFDLWDLFAVVAYCAAGLWLCGRSAELRIMRGIFGVYAVLALGAFLISSPLGANVGRVLLYLGAPLLLVPLVARRFQPRTTSALLLVGTLVWQTFPIANGLRTATATKSSNAEFWYPVEAFLATHSDPNHRVEVVATDQHWEAFYLAGRGIPLTRGWYRQDDFPANADLYGELTERTYRIWLSRLAVRYVFLPQDRLDYSATREAELLRSGVLPQLATIGDWTVYEVPDATPIATPPDLIDVIAIDSSTVTLQARRAGTYRLRLRYTPYWRVEEGSACVAPREPWATELRVLAPGRITLRFRVGVGSVVKTVLGQPIDCVDEEFVGPLPPGRADPSSP